MKPDAGNGGRETARIVSRRVDLIVATNVLVYYSVFEQSLALSNVASMLRPGGLFLSNQVVQPLPSIPMELLGHTDVPMDLAVPKGGHPSEPVGDRFFSYRRRGSPEGSGTGAAGGRGAGPEKGEAR